MMLVMLWMVAFGQPIGSHAEELDRVLAVAAGRAITWSAALEEANTEALLAGEPPVRLRLSDDGAVERLLRTVERLADQMVMERSRSISSIATEPSPGASEDYVTRAEALWVHVAESFDSPTELAAALARYGLDEAAVRNRLTRLQRLLAFMDYTLRPQVKIEPGAVEEYFQTEFLAQLRREQPSAPQPALEDVRSRIEEILLQRELNGLMGPWLERLKREHGFRWLKPEAATSR